MQPPKDSPPEMMLPVDAVAKTLCLSVDTSRKLIRSGLLPASRIGRFWRVASSDLAAFIAKTKLWKP